MQEKLIQKLQKIQKELHESGINLEKLEDYYSEAKKSFEEAIDSAFTEKDILGELRRKKEQFKTWRISVFNTIFPINYKYVLSMPFIYGMFISMIFFDICLEIYHNICFRFYGIPLVSRKEYFIYDRQLLPYLNWLEKINCVYCSYANNLFRYASEIGGRTERYWCPIKYSRRINRAHSQYPLFVDYLDAENFRSKWKALRDFSDIKESGGLKSNTK